MADDMAQIGDNIAGLQKAYGEGVRKIISLMADRSEINGEIASERATLVAKGLNRTAIAAVVSYARADVDQRKAYDTSYSLGREAIGLPVDGGQFELPAAVLDAADDFEEDDGPPTPPDADGGA